MTRWQAFTTVCDYLRAGLLDGARPRLIPNISWELLVEASSYHLVVPTLAWCLQRDPEVPLEVNDYFRAILAANVKRNTRLLSGLERVVQALNGIDIEPVLLEGTALLSTEAIQIMRRALFGLRRFGPSKPISSGRHRFASNRFPRESGFRAFRARSSPSAHVMRQPGGRWRGTPHGSSLPSVVHAAA